MTQAWLLFALLALPVHAGAGEKLACMESCERVYLKCESRWMDKEADIECSRAYAACVTACGATR